MKKITEKQLNESVQSLMSKLELMEAAAAPAPAPAQNRDLSWQNIGKAAGNVWQGVKNTVGAVGDAATGAYNAVTGAASDVASGFNAAQTPSTGVAAQPASKWPTTPQEITAFQKANGLKADGLIGPNTMQALAKQGIQPPAGFKMAPAKKPAAAKPKDVMAQSPEEAEDERIAQNTAFYNMTPQQQAAYNAGAVQQDATKAAAAQKAQATQQAAQPQPGMQQGVAAAQSAITPNFASQQGAQAPAQPASADNKQGTGSQQPQNAPYSPNVSDVVVYKESVGYDEVDRIISLVHYR